MGGLQSGILAIQVKGFPRNSLHVLLGLCKQRAQHDACDPGV